MNISNKQQKFIYILFTELILYIALNISIYFISIPTVFNLSSFDTVYFQFILILVLIAISDLVVCQLLFESSITILIVHIIEILILGFIGEIVGLYSDLLKAQPDYSVYLFLPKLSLILLIKLGPQLFYLVYILINLILKMLFIRSEKGEKILLYQIFD